MPLADIMRPTSLAGVIGQEHILGKYGVLTQIIASRRVPNMIFYGPPGVGKTTVARIIAKTTNKELFLVNGTNISTVNIKDILAEANNNANPSGVLMYLDEIQYVNKRQQQTLLEALETGKLTLIASTTDNPFFCVHKAIISRCTVFEFKSISSKALTALVMIGFRKMAEETGVAYSVDADVINYICSVSGGDVRRCLNIVELSALASAGTVTLDIVKALNSANNLGCSDDDTHLDILSALHKSIRGSDPDAALYYAARLLAVGDLLSLCRRLLAVASEDVGLAYPQAISITKACVDSALQLGLPEARLPLAEAVVLLATAPKSNSIKVAIDAALEDVQANKGGDIPRCLQNTHFDGAGSGVYGQNYLYPHDYSNHYVKQQYLPVSLAGTQYYNFGDNKFEQNAFNYWYNIKNSHDDS